MNRFCTLFDSNYLTRGLAMIRSLQAQGEPFEIAVYCFDDLCLQILSQLNLPQIKCVSLAEFETPELLAVKPQRSRGEYCWTSTSHVIDDAFKRFGWNEVTYLDADLLFFHKPGILLKEFRDANASVLLTEHYYDPKHDRSAGSGRYCVQFMTFRNDNKGRKALTWWKDRCIEWCFNRYEDGKFGDQKYLDDWTERFEGVHVLKHRGGGVAPWNIDQYRLTSGPKVSGDPVVFYHFHDFHWIDGDGSGRFYTPKPLTADSVRWIYHPYMNALRAALGEIRKIDPEFNRGKSPAPKRRLGIRPALRALMRPFTKVYEWVPERL